MTPTINCSGFLNVGSVAFRPMLVRFMRHTAHGREPCAGDNFVRFNAGSKMLTESLSVWELQVSGGVFLGIPRAFIPADERDVVVVDENRTTWEVCCPSFPICSILWTPDSESQRSCRLECTSFNV